MAVDGIRMNEVDVLMGLGTLHHWTEEWTLWRDGFEVINSVVRIRSFFSDAGGGVRLFLRTLPWWSVFPDVFCARLVPVRLVQIGSQGSKRWLRFSGQRPCFKGWWWWFSCSVESDSVTPWTVAHQTPLSVEFIRQECWSAVPFPSPEDLPNPRIKLVSLPSISRQVTTEPPGEPVLQCY